MNKFRPIDVIKKHKVLSVLAVLVLLLVLAFAIPPLVGDGAGRFSGLEKQIAKQELEAAYRNQDSMSRVVDILSFQFYVEDVYPMQPEQAKKYCSLAPQDSGNDYYAVDISRVTIFGFRGDKGTSLGDCINRKHIPNNP
jgi:hypothetical protein